MFMIARRTVRIAAAVLLLQCAVPAALARSATGTRRNNEANVTRAMAAHLLEEYGMNAASAVWRDDASWTEKETAFVCSLQRGLRGSSADASMIAGQMVSPYMGRSAESVSAMLTHPVLCTAINAALKPAPVAESGPVRRAFYVRHGWAVSLTNPTWSKCFAGTAQLNDIRMNPDRQEKTNRPHSCDHYSKAENVWWHPDGLTFTIGQSLRAADVHPAGRVRDGGAGRHAQPAHHGIHAPARPAPMIPRAFS